MTGWTATVLLLAALAATLFYWSRSRSPKIRYDQLVIRVKRLKRGRDVERSEAVLQQVYHILHAGLAAGDTQTAYKAIDLLKIAFGEGVVRQGESNLITAVCIRSVRNKQPEVAAASIDVFRLILRLLPTKEIPVAMEQLAFIAAVGFKDKQAFLAAKAAEVIFTVLERADLISEPAITEAAVRALRLIGILALRRVDNGLFREINNRLAATILRWPQNERLRTEIIALSAVWLHRITRENDVAMYDVLLELISRMMESKLISPDELGDLVKEWQNIAGTASLNPHNLLAARICQFTLQLVLNQSVLRNWEIAINGAGQVVRMSVVKHGINIAFANMLALLVTGRSLLFLELKIGSAENPDTFRQQALYYVVRECLALAEFIARQDMASSAGDIIGAFYCLWLQLDPEAGRKSVKRFCQLLLIYWQQTSRHAKGYIPDDDLAQPVLFSESEIQRLGFLL